MAMAFSILRTGVRSGIGILEKNVAAAGPVAANHNFELGLTREAHALCPCTQKRLLTTCAKPVATNLLIRSYGTHVRKPEKKLKTQSDSDSESDHEVLGHRAESEFWRRKIRTFHGILDINKDGVVSFDDFKLLTEKFVNLGHMSIKHQQEFQRCITDLWVAQWGEINPYNLVTVEQYLEDMHHVLNDKELKKKASSFLPYLFKAVDKDKSGALSVDDFKLFFECLGLGSEDAVLSFRTIDTNSDGKITIKEFVKHGKDFFLTEDEENISRYFWGPLVDH